ncbi:MAG: MFS transporter [Armatimonadetes bacterium]|nr:MFS transporter [Armatimonadota bacterium]
MFLKGLWPSDSLTTSDVRQGLRMLLFDGICTQVMLVLTGGAFLVAFALLLGASSKTIGIIAAMGPLAQVLQLPSVFLVRRLGVRKALVTTTAGISRFFLLIMAAVPWLLPPGLRLPVFILALFLFFGVGAVGGSAFGPWMRDLVPSRVLGRYFGTRLAYAVAIGAIAAILAGVGVDYYRDHFSPEGGAFTILYVIGASVGFLGVFFLSRIPEPRMTTPPALGIVAAVREPFGDPNFRKLLAFMATWNFAANLAAPFFAVYMLERLGISMTWVMALFLLSQLAYVSFLGVWGRLADRLTHRAVLSVSGPLFMVSIALWLFTTMPERYFLTIPLLALIHVLAGISTAGVALSAWNIALKLAPKDSSTTYLAANALVCGIAATVAPIMAGVAADWLSSSGVALTVGSRSANGIATFPALSLHGLDLVFLVAVMVGIYAIRRLALVQERGSLSEKLPLGEIAAEMRTTVRNISNIAGLRQLSGFPYGILRRQPTGRDGSRDSPPDDREER